MRHHVQSSYDPSPNRTGDLWFRNAPGALRRRRPERGVAQKRSKKAGRAHNKPTTAKATAIVGDLRISGVVRRKYEELTPQRPALDRYLLAVERSVTQVADLALTLELGLVDRPQTLELPRLSPATRRVVRGVTEDLRVMVRRLRELRGRVATDLDPRRGVR